MRDDYNITGPTKEVSAQLENEVVEKLKTMCEHTKLSESEIINTALKRFIVTHKDFLPKRPA